MTQGSPADPKGRPAAKSANKPGTGPLTGVRVLDLTSVLFGPYACQWLGDFGADVVKVEAPGGDNSRFLEPMRNRGMGTIFLTANRNKRSVGLDLKLPAGQAALLKLVATADVFVHNLRPTAARRLGIDYASLQRVKPDIIYASANGFGSQGPYAGKPAYDDIIQAASGLADISSRILDADGQKRRPPSYAPASIADKVSGLTLLSAVLAALYHRCQTGEGQELEVPMFESLVAFNMVEHMTGAVFDPKNGKMGYPRLLSPDRRPYRTKDGWITVLPYSDKHWAAFFKAAGRTHMLDDPRVTDLRVRSRELGTLYAMLTDIMPERTTAEWLDMMSAADVPATRVSSLEDVIADPHLKAVDFFKTVEHPSEGTLCQPGVPIRFSKSVAEPTRLPTPLLGEHSREVLAEVGFTRQDIADLLKAGAVFEGFPASGEPS